MSDSVESIPDWAMEMARDALCLPVWSEASPDVKDIARAFVAAHRRGMREAAGIAERDADWTAFQRNRKPHPLTGAEQNLFAPPNDPDDTMPTDANVFAYRIGIAAGRAIAAAIRSAATSK